MSHTRASEEKTQKGLGSKVNHHYQTSISKEQFAAGNVTNKIAIPLSDGKTIVFANPSKDIEKVRKFWEKRLGLI